MLKYIFPFSFLLFSCSEEVPKQKAGFENNKSSRQEKLDYTSEINKEYSNSDFKSIKSYAKRYNLDLTDTGSGLQYQITKKTEGEQAKEGQLAILGYTVSLLDGTKCYSSEVDGDSEILIGEEDVESGLHEAVKMLKVGEKGVFIIPYHSAHGLLGDDNKIPPLSVVVFRLELKKLEGK